MKKTALFIIVSVAMQLSLSAQNIVREYSGGKPLYKNKETGEIISPAGKYDFGSDFYASCNCALVGKNGKRGYIDTKGELMIPLQYDDASQFFDGKAWVAKKEGNTFLYGFIDLNTKVVSEFKYTAASDYKNGIARVANKDGKWGFIDINENVAIPFKFSNARDFSEGLAAVEEAGKWGFINNKGQYIVPAKYNNALSYTKMPNGIVAARVVDNSRKETNTAIYIGTKGEFIAEEKRSELEQEEYEKYKNQLPH